MIWFLFGLLVLLALALPLYGLLRSHKDHRSRRESEMSLYRQQLDDLDTDLDRCLISAEDAEAARLEIQRRLLKADKRAEITGHGRHLPPLVIAACLAVFILAAWPLYLWLGAPDAPSRKAPPPIATTIPGMDGKNMATLLDDLEQQLATHPERVDGWLLLGRSAMGVDQPGRAARAYQSALTRAPDDADIHASLGESLVAVAEGRITAAADLAFSRALSRDPENPKALYYVGLGLLQNNRPEEALMRWQTLLNASPDDAPWRSDIEGRVDDLTALVARRQAPAGPRALGADDLAAVADMSPEERQNLVESMVARLADRLSQNPDDPDGWMRLASAYRVMNRPDEELHALKEARALVPAMEQAAIDQRIMELQGVLASQ